MIDKDFVRGIDDLLELGLTRLGQFLVAVGQRLEFAGAHDRDADAFLLVGFAVLFVGRDDPDRAHDRALASEHFASRAAEPVRGAAHGTVRVGRHRLDPVIDQADQFGRVIDAGHRPATGIDVEQNLGHFRVFSSGQHCGPDLRIARHPEVLQPRAVAIDQRPLDAYGGNAVLDGQQAGRILVVFVIVELTGSRALRKSLFGGQRGIVTAL